MSDERIDIEVTDKVDGNIEKKILGIADASTKGYSAVQKLKSALKDVNTSAVSKLAAASASATNALAREMNATAKLTVARSRAAEIDARAAVAMAKLATEQARTAAMTLKAQAAADRAAAAKDKEANASAKLTAELAREASAKQRIIHDPVQITPAAPGSLGGQAGSREAVAAQTNAMRRVTPIITPAEVKPMQDGAKAADELNNSLGKAGVGAGLARHQMVNLGYQLQDIVVSLQAGQAPLTVFIQQGSQIAGIAASSGVGLMGMAKAVWALVAPFTPLIAVLAAAYFGFKKFTADSAAAHRPELVAYANTLGLTSKEMRKLGNETVDANGKLKSFDTVTITMGDSWNGFIATVKEGLSSLTGPFQQHSSAFAEAWGYAVGFARNVFIGFYGLVMTLIKTTFNLLGNIVRIAANAALVVAQSIIKAVNWAINLAIDGINLLLRGYNAAQDAMGFDKPVKELGHFDAGIKSVTDGMLGMLEIDPAKTLTTEIQTADRTLRAFGQTWDRNNVKAAKARIAAEAAAVRAQRNPKAPPKPHKEADPKTQGDYLVDINKKLDDELARMKMLKQARDEQARMDQIEEDFIKRRMPLDAQTLAALRAKVHAIEEYKFVQAESDRIYEDAIAPLRTYNATLKASADLLAQHAISAEQASHANLLASRAYKESTDPLFSMNEELARNVDASKLYGQAVEQNAYAEQVRQAFLAKGIDLLTNATEAEKASAAAIIAKNNALLQQNFIQSQVGEIVNPMLDQQRQIDNAAAMYAEIDRLRQTDVLNEEQAARAKHALDAKFLEMRVSNMANTFGELAKLSSSGNAELAAIGKAAAVVQATIDGYVAVQKALASGPPPWNFIQAAAVGVMTGVQVAGILSTNVGSFATGGQFMVDGRAGVDNNNISMNVSRGERVTVETPHQQRMADGSGGGGERPLNVKVVNVTDPKDIEATLADPANDHLVLNVLRRNPAQARQLAGGR